MTFHLVPTLSSDTVPAQDEIQNLCHQIIQVKSLKIQKSILLN